MVDNKLLLIAGIIIILGIGYFTYLVYQDTIAIKKEIDDIKNTILSGDYNEEGDEYEDEEGEYDEDDLEDEDDYEEEDEDLEDGEIDENDVTEEESHMDLLEPIPEEPEVEIKLTPKRKGKKQQSDTSKIKEVVE